MTQKITRKRALELAMECISSVMVGARKDMQLAVDSLYRDDKYKQKRVDRYAELAAALAYIENMARKKELL